MQNCIQNYKLMRREPNPDNEVLSIRIKDGEAFRFYNLFMAALAKNKHIDKSNIIRELIGLDEPELLTVSEIEYFRTGKKYELPKKQKPSPTNDINIMGKSIPPPLEAVKTKRRKTG